ncbi:MAG: PKD domain-containing protein [Thermoplasmata archaeon]
MESAVSATQGRIDRLARGHVRPKVDPTSLVRVVLVLGVLIVSSLGLSLPAVSRASLPGPLEPSRTILPAGNALVASSASSAPSVSGLTAWEVGQTIFPEGNASAVRGNLGYLSAAPSIMAYDGTDGAYWIGSATGPNPLFEVSATNLATLQAAPSVLSSSGLAFDRMNGLLYSLSNGTVSAVNVSTGARAGPSLPVEQGGALGQLPMMFVPSASELFVPSITSPNGLVVVSTTNDSVVKNISFGGGVTGAIDMTYDPIDQSVYALTIPGSKVFAINVSTLTVAANVSIAGFGPSNITYDAATGQVLVANALSDNITVIDPTTGSSVGSGFSLPFSPRLFTVDPESHRIYVSAASFRTNLVYALNDSTGATLGPAIAVGSGVAQVVYNAANGTVLTLNSIDNNISAINGTNGAVVENSPTIGAMPVASADDPAIHTLFVADEAGSSGLLERIDTRTLASAGPPIPLASSAIGAIATDPAANVVLVAYAPASGDGAVQEINATTGREIGKAVSVGNQPDAIGYDAATGDAYIAIRGNHSVTSFNVNAVGVVGAPFAVGIAPTSILVIPGDEELWVVNSASSNISVFNVTSHVLETTISTSPFPLSAAYDSALGYVYVTADVQTSGFGTEYTRVLDLINATTFSLVTSVPFSAAWDLSGIVYDPGSQDLFTLSDNQCGCGTAPDAYNGTVSVIDGSSVLTSEAAKFSIPVGERPYSFTFVPNPTGASEIWVNNFLTGTLSVIALPPALRLLRVTPSTTEVGVPVTLETIYSGGGSPSITYTGLPPGCVSAPLVFLECVPTGQGSYRIVSTLSDPVTGTTLTASTTLTVDPPVQLTLSSSTHPIDVGDSISFLAAPAGGLGPYSISWEFGDGQGANGSSVTHSYATPGMYAVTARVIDSLSGTASSALVVTVASAPSVTISAPTLATDVGFPVFLSATLTGGSSPVAYNWSLGNGQTANGPSVNTSYSVPAAYTVTLTAQDGAGHSVYATDVVRIAALPQVTASAQVSSVAVGNQLQFTANGTGGTGTLQYAWEFGDGSGTVGSAPGHLYAVAGTYTAVVWANDSVGGSGRSIVTITVVAPKSSHPSNTSPHSSGSSSGYAASWLVVAAIIGLIVGVLIGTLMARRRPPPPLKPMPPPVPPAAAWSEAPIHPGPSSGSGTGSGPVQTQG